MEVRGEAERKGRGAWVGQGRGGGGGTLGLSRGKNSSRTCPCLQQAVEVWTPLAKLSPVRRPEDPFRASPGLVEGAVVPGEWSGSSGMSQSADPEPREGLSAPGSASHDWFWLVAERIPEAPHLSQHRTHPLRNQELLKALNLSKYLSLCTKSSSRTPMKPCGVGRAEPEWSRRGWAPAASVSALCHDL